MPASFSLERLIHNRRSAIGAMLITAVLWSSSGLFIKLLSWPAIAVLGLRGLIASVVFLIWLRPSSFRFTRIQWLTAISFTFAQLAYFIGNKNAPAANIIFLSYTAPLYIIPLGIWLLNERPRRSDWLAMLVIFSGMLLFLGDGFGSDGLLGNLWGVLAGVLIAGMTVGMRMQKDGNPAESILLSHMLSALIGMPFALQQTWDVQSLTIIGYMGIIQIGFSFFLYSIAVKQITALETIIITMLEPVLNPILVFWVLGEVPGTLALIGAALVIVGVLYRATTAARQPL